MDSAYDHIHQEALPKEEDVAPKETDAASPTLNAEFQEAWGAVASSPWAARIGGLWGSVRKTGEQYYAEAQKQTAAASTQASKGLNDIITRTRGLSLLNPEDAPKEGETTDVAAGAEQKAKDLNEHPDRPESLTADIVKEATSIVSRFRSEAAKRIKDIEKAEDAADEALLRLGNNIYSFLQDAVSIAPPTEVIGQEGENAGKVLFESKDSDGKRIIHTSRFEAQLHVIHCSADGFLKDPAGPEYAAWEKEFDVGAKTEMIAKELEKYEELRKAMEKVVPEKVDYPNFWKRYYFLRRVAELEEQRRKDLLKGAASVAQQEEVGWDEESDDEANNPDAKNATPIIKAKAIIPPKPTEIKSNTLEAKKPHDLLSQPDSEASYDIISAATSKAGGSPREVKKVEESDEEDWE